MGPVRRPCYYGGGSHGTAVGLHSNGDWLCQPCWDLIEVESADRGASVPEPEPPPPPIDADEPAHQHDPTLPIENIAVIAARVDALPSPTFIARPVWPSDAYGVIGAENKAGKTWAILDLAVAVATGGAWLGQYPCDHPGPVLAFLGEGGERKMVRRLRAVCSHYQTRLEDLPLRICPRAPQLAVAGHIDTITKELAEHRPALVIVDPLYLAAKGAKASSLFEMATVLEPIQHACQQHGAALVVVHHWNKTGEGKGRDRFSGAGSAEWGRVLASVAVESRHTEHDGASNVVLAWDFIGDEIPDTTLRIRRRVSTDNPADLGSPMTYSVEHLAERRHADAGPLADERPAVRRVALHLAAGNPLTVRHIGDLLAADNTGIPLKPRTIQDALNRLRDLGIATDTAAIGPGGASIWTATTPTAHETPHDNTATEQENQP